MFPLRDHNPSKRVQYVTYALIAANVVIFLSYVPLFNNAPALIRFYDSWALIPARLEPHGYVTSMFLHGGWMHLLGNMLFLWIFGDNLEDEMGHLGFALFYLASGIGAGLIHTLSDPLSEVPTVGASGAIAGVMGGYLLLFPKARVDVLFIFIIFFKVIPLPAWVMLGAWFGLQLFNGIGSSAEGGGVAYWAHAGGFVIGAILAMPIWLRLGGTSFWSKTHGVPPHPEATYVRSSIPKVPRHSSGIPRVPRRRR
ncbi:MAG: rhomboid family intramembrane serine protease [Pseudomonadota bacterium]